MQTKISLQDPATLATPLLAVFAADTNTATGPDATPTPTLLTTNAALQAAAAAVLGSGEYKAGNYESVVIHAPQGVTAERLLIVGLGKLSKVAIDDTRKAAGTAVRAAKPRGIRTLAIALPENEAFPPGPCAQAMIEGAYIGDFDPDTYRSDRKDQSIESFTLISNIAEGSPAAAAIQAGFNRGVILGTSLNFTRTLVNEPGNYLTPTILGARAKAELEPLGIKTEVYGAEKLHELKMGAFWGVSQGSEEPPALIVMTYEPKKATSNEVLGLVGKGITFDTGGISIKPADKMELMKYDMAGGAAMIGAMRAIALLKPSVKVISVVCASENMPDGKAQKPGDVRTTMSGKTIEIINTDAEGRLVLADGLAYARQLGATKLIDAATLTGACVVALGNVFVGAFANDEPTYEKFQKASAITGEHFWRLPLHDEFREQIKSGIADMMNTGGRWGGASTAAALLEEFAEDTPWIHLDIAGMAWIEDSRPYIAKGPSGIAVRTLVEWVNSYTK
jgi:leucyl aminopeptidase